MNTDKLKFAETVGMLKATEMELEFKLSKCSRFYNYGRQRHP